MPAHIIARRKGSAPVALYLPENLDAPAEAFLWSQLEAFGKVSKGYGHPPKSANVFEFGAFLSTQIQKLETIKNQFAGFTPEPQPNITPEPDKVRAPECATTAQLLARPFFAIARDKFFSGWGKAKDRASIYIVACKTLGDAERAEKWLNGREEMRSVRVAQKYDSKKTEHVCVTAFELTAADPMRLK
jgi:hypothetical protein